MLLVASHAMRQVLFFCLAAALHAQGPAVGPEPARVRQLLDRHRAQMTPAFEFAAIGDQQYGPTGEARFPALRDAINRAGVAFAVHTGDVKSGSTLCDDAMFADRVRNFNLFEMPLMLTPGDNEWTDCHRANNGSYDALERLAHLRAVFYPDNQSMGRRKLALSLQSEDPRFSKYRENSMWSSGNVLFAMLHVVGSNNNLGRTPENDQEYDERTRANSNWIKTIFQVARDGEFAGVVLTMQANPGFDILRRRVSQFESGFRETFAEIEDEVIVYDRPVLLIHGDSHEFHLDKPLLGTRSGQVIENLIRLEVPGSADVHWIRVRVNPAKPGLFGFEHEDIPEHRARQQRP